MISTYLTFDLVNRDMQKSLSRVAGQQTVANDTKYYQENIGKVKTVDEFLDNYRLYTYAVKAHGLEEMAYAKAFMKQVLESDLGDDNSFANRLTDERYKNFAAAFNFGASSASAAVAQSEGQMEELFDIYDQTIATLNDTTAEETRYFKVMLGTAGNIKNVDDFLRNDRLREFVFTAYGYEGKYYNYAAIRGVLTSDPNDPNSYYNTAFGNRLSSYNNADTEIAEMDERTQLTSTVSTTQNWITLGQQQKETLESQIASKQEELDNGGDAETLEAEIADLQTQLDDTEERLAHDQQTLATSQTRLDELNAKLVPEDQVAARKAELEKLKTGVGTDLNFLKLMEMFVNDFNFNTDGSVPAGGVVTADKLQEIVGGYFSKQKRMTNAEAMYNQELFQAKLTTATTVEELTSDTRIVNYLKVAFNLNESYIVKSTIERILLNDNGIVEEYATTRPQYKALYEAFNFASDGTLNEGGILAAGTTMESIRSNYMSRWDDKLDAEQEKTEGFYKLEMGNEITSVNDLFTSAASASLAYALTAVGIDRSEYSDFKLKAVFKSDLSDPKSYIYTLKDERLVTLAKLFNFKSDGEVGTPVMAQSNAAITSVASDYILRKTRFLEGKELEAAKAKAQEEAKYYTSTMQRIDTRDDLLADRKLMDILLTSKGYDPKEITDDFLKKLFESDLDDPESFANTQADKKFAQIVGTFNFDANGDIDRTTAGEIQNGGEIAATVNNYVRQMLETEQGEENPGVRLALYFERMADSITDPYVILGDEALFEFFRVAYQLPSEIGNMEVDQQAKLVEKNLNLADLSDPEALKKLITRFTVMYDLENTTTSTSAVDLINGSSAGISADTLWALSQIRMG